MPPLEPPVAGSEPLRQPGGPGGPPETTSLLQGILRLLEEIADNTPSLFRFGDNENIEQVVIRRVTVTTSGEPVQGPDIPVPKGYPIIVRQRHHAATNPVGRVAFSRNAIQDAATRSHLADGESAEIRVSNTKFIWFDSDTADTEFEVWVELIPRTPPPRRLR